MTRPPCRTRHRGGHATRPPARRSPRATPSWVAQSLHEPVVSRPRSTATGRRSTPSVRAAPATPERTAAGARPACAGRRRHPGARSFCPDGGAGRRLRPLTPTMGRTKTWLATRAAVRRVVRTSRDRYWRAPEMPRRSPLAGAARLSRTSPGGLRHGGGVGAARRTGRPCHGRYGEAGGREAAGARAPGGDVHRRGSLDDNSSGDRRWTCWKQAPAARKQPRGVRAARHVRP